MTLVALRACFHEYLLAVYVSCLLKLQVLRLPRRATFNQYLIVVYVSCLLSLICCLRLPFARPKYTFLKTPLLVTLKTCHNVTTAQTQTQTHTDTYLLRCCMNKHMTGTTNHALTQSYFCSALYAEAEQHYATFFLACKKSKRKKSLCLLYSVALLDKMNK